MLILVVIILALFVFISAVFKFGWGWTGFRSYRKIIIHTSGKDIELQQGKTLWDLLQLFIIPVLLTFGGIWFTKQQNQDRTIAKDNQQEKALQAYIDAMSELLLKEGLRSSQPNDEVRQIAQVRTLTVLNSLDGTRKRQVVQFLTNAQLIKIGGRKKNSIINLEDADLNNANLYFTNLNYTNFQWAKLNFANLNTFLINANLSNTALNYANLKSAFLLGANLTGASLHGANLECINYDEKTIWADAEYDNDTKFPPGFDPIGKGMKKFCPPIK